MKYACLDYTCRHDLFLSLYSILNTLFFSEMATKRVMYTLEFPIRSSPTILYEYLSTPVGLQEWFADKVDQRDKMFYFTWNGSVDTAELIEAFENNYVRYRWDYYAPDEFFEMRIEQSPVTNETILRISDFVDDKSEIRDQEMLWNSQIADLKHRIGA